MCRSSTATRPGPPRIWPRAGAGRASATSCSGRRHGSPGCTSCSSACSKGGVAPCCAASPPSACSSSTAVSGSVRDDRTALGAGLSADGRRHRPPARRARAALSTGRVDRFHAPESGRERSGRAVRRGGGQAADEPALHEDAPGVAALVAARDGPGAPAPRALCLLRQPEARGLPGALGVRADTRPLRRLPLRRRSAFRAAQVPQLQIQTPLRPRDPRRRGRLRRHQQLDARPRTHRVGRAGARRPRATAARRAPRHRSRALSPRGGGHGDARAARNRERRGGGTLARDRGTAGEAQGHRYGARGAPHDRRAGAGRALRGGGGRPRARVAREARAEAGRGGPRALPRSGERARPARAVQPGDGVRRRLAARGADRRGGVRHRAGRGVGVRGAGRRGKLGRRARRGARRGDGLPRAAGGAGGGGRGGVPAARRPRAGAAPRRRGAPRGRDLLQLGSRRPRRPRHRIRSGGVGGGLFPLPPFPFPVLNPTLLLAFNFPPHGGGIARMMGEIALRYPAGSLVVSTGAYANSAASDARFPHPVDRVAIRATRLRTLDGLVLWTARASRLARRHAPGFAWCAELKPAAYPARWLNARRQLPYGIVVHGTELLLLEEKTARSAFKRWTGRQLFAGCAVVVANSRWTAERASALVTALGCGALARDVRVVPPGTTPSLFRPGIDPRPIRAKHGLEGGPWLLTVSRLDWHKGIDTGIKALPAVRAVVPTARYAVAGVGRRRPPSEPLPARRRLGAAGRRAVETFYNWDRVARDFIRIDAEFRRRPTGAR